MGLVESLSIELLFHELELEMSEPPLLPRTASRHRHAPSHRRGSEKGVAMFCLYWQRTIFGDMFVHFNGIILREPVLHDPWYFGSLFEPTRPSNLIGYCLSSSQD